MIMQVYPCCSCNRRRSWRSGGCCSQMLVRNRETSWRKKGTNEENWRRLQEKKQIKWKRKKKTGKKNNFHWGQAVGCSVACLGSLTIWLIKFSKPQTNHSKNLIKCVKKIVYYFYKNKVVCLQFYNHFFISSFSHNSFLCFTFLLLFLHFHNVLLCTLYTWGGKSPENLKLAMH